MTTPITLSPAPSSLGGAARLALHDGSVFSGRAFGAVGDRARRAAEVVFNTSMVGYQEALTDPSYAGQILVMTQPMIGNYGASPADTESARVQVSGFVVRELSALASNFRATVHLADLLAQQGVLGISEIDTRALTRRLRTAGVMQGVLTDDPSPSDAELVAQARSAPSMAGLNLVPLVGCSSKQTWDQTLGGWNPIAQPGAAQAPPRTPRALRVLALDCGAKSNILRHLTQRGCQVEVFPHDTPPTDILARFAAGQFDGLFISNGPGDPAAVLATVATLRAVLAAPPGQVPPTFGICLGHQMLALALGAKTYKLPFGHRGANQPVKNLLTGRVEITSQNHGFAVEPESLAAAGGQATHVHLNDGTLAGFRLTDRPVFCVQYHPEASPGPHDSGYLFDAFVAMMIDRRPTAFASVSRADGPAVTAEALAPV